MFKKRILKILNHNYSLYFFVFLGVLIFTFMGLSKRTFAHEPTLWIPVSPIKPGVSVNLPDNISFHSVDNPVLIWDFNQWEKVSLQDIHTRLIKNDPRGEDTFQSFRDIFFTAEGKSLLFVEKKQSSYSFYNMLRKANLKPLDPLISKERWTLILLLAFFPSFFLLRFYNRWEKISLFLLWVSLSIWGGTYAPLILLWALLIILLKERDKKAEKIIYSTIAFLFFISFGFITKSFWLMLLCINHLSIVMLSPSGGILRDHPLLEPVLLLKRHRFTPRTSISKQDKLILTLFVSILFLVSLISTALLNKSSNTLPDNAMNYIPDEKTVLDHLSFQKSLSFLRKEDWQEYSGEEINVFQTKGNFREGIKEETMLPASSQREYWLDSLPEDSLEYWVIDIRSGTASTAVNTWPWQFLLLLSVISWLTILAGLWQSNMDFDSQSYFVFKMKRRLKVA